MATVAAIRAAASLKLLSPSPASTSDCRNGPQISFPYSRIGSSPASFPISSSAAAAALSSSRSYVPFGSTSKQFPQAHGRPRDAARVAGASASPRCETDSDEGKTPFGYTRKDVIGIGLGLLGLGVALKYGLELFGVDSIKAGNAVQLIMVLGLTVGWISTYVFRVSSKEMTYAKQLKDYENKVMEKRLEEMPEAELESMLAQIEEEKRILRESRDKIL